MEDNSVEIVCLPVTEWQEYKQLRLEALRESPQAFGSSYASMVERPDSFWQGRLAEATEGQGHWLLFAREHQRLLGMIGAMIEEDEPQKTASVISVYVRSEARGQGISRLLMRAILAELEKAGVQKARLGVNTKQLPALHLYQSFGFAIVDTIEHLLMGNGEYHDEYVMEKDL